MKRENLMGDVGSREETVGYARLVAVRVNADLKKLAILIVDARADQHVCSYLLEHA